MNGRLGSTTLTAGSLTTLYQVPANIDYAATSVSIVNRHNIPALIRMAVSNTTTPTLAEWIEYDVEIPAKGVLERTGLVLGSTQLIMVFSNIDLVNVVAMGAEIVEGGVASPPPEPEPPSSTAVTVLYGGSGASTVIDNARFDGFLSSAQAVFGSTRSLAGNLVTGFAGRANAVNIPLSQGLTGPLTLECWSYITTSSAPDLLLHGPTETDLAAATPNNYIRVNAVSIGSTASSTSIIQGGSSIVNNLTDTGLTPIAPGQWVHTALVLNSAGNQLSVWINGDRRIQDITLSSAFTSTLNYLTLNAFGTGEASYVDEVRVSNVERYDRTQNSITVPTGTFTSDANTLALIKFDS